MTSDCGNCGEQIKPSETSPTGFTHVERGGHSGGDWCNPDYTPGNAHTLAEPVSPGEDDD